MCQAQNCISGGIRVKMVYALSRLLFPLYRVLWMKKVTGLEHIPKKGGFILAANHASHLDAFLFSVIIPVINRTIHFIAFKKYAQHWLFGPLLKHYGAISTNGSVEKALALLKQGKIMGIFPEGRRSFTGKIGRPHIGVAVLAMNAKKPVIPIGIKGTFEIWPRQRKLPRLRRIAEINIGKPMRLKGKLTKTNIRRNAQKVMDSIAELAK